jgi:hypothetical protein
MKITDEIAHKIREEVNPAHYKTTIECIEAIKSAMTEQQFQGYLRGNVIKYLWRYEQKGGQTDLKKAEWYLKRLIEEL